MKLDKTSNNHQFHTKHLENEKINKYDFEHRINSISKIQQSSPLVI